MEYYVALKKKWGLSHATIYINLKDIMPNEKLVPKGQILYDSIHMK